MLTSAQLTEWIAYNELEPIGDWRGDYQAAMVCSTLVNVVRAAFGKKSASKILDFMPNWDKSEEPQEEQKGQSVEEMKAILMNVASVQNKIYRDKKGTL